MMMIPMPPFKNLFVWGEYLNSEYFTGIEIATHEKFFALDKTLDAVDFPIILETTKMELLGLIFIHRHGNI